MTSAGAQQSLVERADDCPASDRTDCLELDPRVHFRLAHDRRMGAETLDDGANERPGLRGCQQHGNLALLRSLL